MAACGGEHVSVLIQAERRPARTSGCAAVFAPLLRRLCPCVRSTSTSMEPAATVFVGFELESQQVTAAVAVAATAALRGVAFAASLAAAILVVTNRQARWGVKVDFTMFQVWVAFVATNFLCAVYAAATAILLKKLVSKRWLHHLDQVMVNLEAAAAAGAGAIGSIAMWGNQPSGWYPVCRMYRRYCNVGLAALVLSLVAVLALGAACALSRYPRSPARPGDGDGDGSCC